MLHDSDIESLERATLDAVAPPVVEDLPGWVLPFDHTTIGRAKSAVPLRHAAQDTSLVQKIVDRYNAHQLPAAFRVADVAGLSGIHQELTRLGFTPQQPTLVQVGSAHRILEQVNTRAKDLVTLTVRPTAQWSEVYTAPGFDLVDGAHRVQALSRSHTVVFASISDPQGPAAAGTASFSHGWASLHGMRTVERAQGRGLGGGVVAALAQKAIANGINRMFLQVEEGNTAALALYQRAGFQTAWRYHYWRDLCLN
jgi:GNAT superfamily N-acetyltransferase